MDFTVTSIEAQHMGMSVETAEDIEFLCVQAHTVLGSDGCRWIDIRTLNPDDSADMLTSLCIDDIANEMLVMAPGSENFVRVTDAAMSMAVLVLMHIRPNLCAADSMRPAADLQNLISAAYKVYQADNLRELGLEQFEKRKPLSQQELDEGLEEGRFTPLAETYTASELSERILEKLRNPKPRAMFAAN